MRQNGIQDLKFVLIWISFVYLFFLLISAIFLFLKNHIFKFGIMAIRAISPKWKIDWKSYFTYLKAFYIFFVPMSGTTRFKACLKKLKKAIWNRKHVIILDLQPICQFYCFIKYLFEMFSQLYLHSKLIGGLFI